MTEHAPRGNGAEPALSPAARRSRAYRQRQRLKRDATPNATADVASVMQSVTSAASRLTNVAPGVAIGVAHRGVTTLGAVLGLVGITLALLGLGMTVTYSTIGTVGTDRLLFAGLAGSTDLLALVTPSAAVILWRAPRRLLSIAAWGLWITSAAVTMTNLSGYVASHADTFTSTRENAAVTRAMTLERVTRLRAERNTVNEHRSAGEIVVAIRNAGRRTIDDERAALAIARHRDQLDADLARLEHSIGTLPAVTAADPAAAGLAGIVATVTAGHVVITAETVRRARLLLLLMLPLCGGLVLAVGAAVAARRKRTE